MTPDRKRQFLFAMALTFTASSSQIIPVLTANENDNSIDKFPTHTPTPLPPTPIPALRPGTTPTSILEKKSILPMASPKFIEFGSRELRIVQQPADDFRYISLNNFEITQLFQEAENGVIVLAAHNYLAGRLFADLDQGDNIKLKFDGQKEVELTVREIHRYQRINKRYTSTLYRDLETNELLGTDDITSKFYNNKDNITLQTCIENGNDPNWGLLFITASSITSSEEPQFLIE